MLQHRLILDALEQLVVTPERAFPCQGSQLPSAPNSSFPTSQSMSKTLHCQMPYFAFSTSFWMPNTNTGTGGIGNFPLKGRMQHGVSASSTCATIGLRPKWASVKPLSIHWNPGTSAINGIEVPISLQQEDILLIVEEMHYTSFTTSMCCVTFAQLFDSFLGLRCHQNRFLVTSFLDPTVRDILNLFLSCATFGHSPNWVTKKTALLRLAVSSNDA